MKKQKSFSSGMMNNVGSVTLSGSTSSAGITTTATSNITSTYTTWGNAGISISKSKYHILGEDYEFEGYIEGNTAIVISTLNVLGRPFWEELKKNNVSFGSELEEFIERRLTILDRDKKIDDIIN